MSNMNFEQALKPVTLYGRTITFTQRTINNQSLFVPRHITFDVKGYWNITLNNRVTQVTAGEDLHYSLNVAWKELKRRMSEELPAKRKRPRIRTKPMDTKHIDTGLVGVTIYPHQNRCRIQVAQTLDRRYRSLSVASIPMTELTQHWLDRNLHLGAKVRKRYEELAQAGQLRELVQPEDVADTPMRINGLRRVLISEVIEDYERRTGERIEPKPIAVSGPLPESAIRTRSVVGMPDHEIRYSASHSTPALTVGRWLLPRLAHLFTRLAHWFGDQAKALD